MNNILRKVLITLIEILLITILPIAFYVDMTKGGVSLHPMFYCVVTYANCRLLDKQYDRYLGLMFIVDSIIFVAMNAILAIISMVF